MKISPDGRSRCRGLSERRGGRIGLPVLLVVLATGWLARDRVLQWAVGRACSSLETRGILLSCRDVRWGAGLTIHLEGIRVWRGPRRRQATLELDALEVRPVWPRPWAGKGWGARLRARDTWIALREGPREARVAGVAGLASIDGEGFRVERFAGRHGSLELRLSGRLGAAPQRPASDSGGPSSTPPLRPAGGDESAASPEFRLPWLEPALAWLDFQEHRAAPVVCEGSLSMDLGRPETFRGRLRLEGREFRWRGLAVASVEAEGEVTAGGLAVERSRLEAEDGTLELQGAWDWAAGRVRVDSADSSLDLLAVLAACPPADLSRLGGTHFVEPPVLRLRDAEIDTRRWLRSRLRVEAVDPVSVILAPRGVENPARIDDLMVSLEVEAGALSLRPFRGTLRGWPFDVEMDVRPAAEGGARLTGEVYDARGSWSVDGVLHGAEGADGERTAFDLHVARDGYLTLSGVFDGANDVVAVDRFRSDLDPVALARLWPGFPGGGEEGSGAWNLVPPTVIEGAHWVLPLDDPGGIEGEVRFDAHIAGHLDRPGGGWEVAALRGSMHVAPGAWEIPAVEGRRGPLGATFTGRWRPGAPGAPLEGRLSIAGSPGSAEATVAVDLGELDGVAVGDLRSDLDWRAAFDALPWAAPPIMDELTFVVPPDIAGEGWIAITDPSASRGTLRWTREAEFEWRDRERSVPPLRGRAMPGEVRFAAGVMEFGPLSVSVAGGTVTLAGRAHPFEPGWPFSGTAAARDVDMGAIGRRFGWGTTWKGRGEADFRGTGTRQLSDLRGGGSFAVADGDPGALPILSALEVFLGRLAPGFGSDEGRRATGKYRMEGGSLHVDPLVMENRLTRVSLVGSIDLESGRIAARVGARVRGAVGLATIPVGHVLELEVEGTATEPEIHLANLGETARVMGVTVETMRATVGAAARLSGEISRAWGESRPVRRWLEGLRPRREGR